MLKKLYLLLLWLLMLVPVCYAIDASKLLPAEQAFVPTITVNDHHLQVHFSIQDGYYLYQQKIMATTEPAKLLASPTFQPAGELKEDDFFGRQLIFHHQVDVSWPYQQTEQPYTLILSYQGCATVGICYPPVEHTVHIKGNGRYTVTDKYSANLKNLLPLSAAASTPPPNPTSSLSTHLQLSRQTLFTNLVAFFIAGLGLSLTACLYPLIPIVSAIVVGQKQHTSKGRAFGLSFIYVQGLAFTYTLVGIITAQTGALVSAWLQQPAVILAAAAILVLLALSMFDLYLVQLPARWQSFFQQMSARFGGDHWFSVLIMGALSALIVGPCVAPPLAFALGYIGQSGDVLLGGLALYMLALGMGMPLMLIAIFGGHILPRAGQWMVGVKYVFGCLLLAAAIYLATPFLPYAVVVTGYTLLLLLPALLLLRNAWHLSSKRRWFKVVLSVVLLFGGGYFATASIMHRHTPLHRLLTLTTPQQLHYGRRFTDPAALVHTLQQLQQRSPEQPVLVDFYADWCVSCKEMAAYTFSQAKVQQVIPSERLLQLDVTQNTPAQQALLRQYGLYGPPGLFMVYADGQHSTPLLGFVQAEQLLEWYQQQQS